MSEQLTFPDPLELISAREFARRLGVHRKTVARWLRAGTVKGRFMTGRWYIYKRSWEQLVASGSETAPDTSYRIRGSGVQGSKEVAA